jgi:general secretion pathway protein C
VPGSIYTKLGIQEGDVLKEVDGERLDSPAKAMELYNGLRTRTNLKISGERNGQPFTMTYNIRQ